MLMTSHSPSPNPSFRPTRLSSRASLVGLVGLKLELGLWAGSQRIFINIGINK